MRGYSQYLAALGPRLKTAIKVGLKSGGARAVAHMVDVSNHRAYHDGGYAARWFFEPIPNGIRVFNKAPYASIIEFGRRAGARMPPPDALRKWVKDRFGVSAKEAKSIAFAVARSISEKGTPGKHVLGFEVDKLNGIIMEEVEREIAEALAKK